MKMFVLCATTLVSASGVALAQPEAAPAAPAAPAAAASTATLGGESPIETLMAKPETKALVNKYFPEIEGHPAYEQFKAMSLRQLEPMAGGIITDEKIKSLESDIKTLK